MSDIFTFFTDGNCVPTKSDGSSPTPTTGVGCTLASASTYYYLPGPGNAVVPGGVPTLDSHLKWDATFVGTFTIETCGFPAVLGNATTGAPDVSNIDTAKGNWLQQNPTGSYITVTSTDGTTGGATVTNATIVIAGGTAGGADINLFGFAGRRLRIKAAVTTGGVVRCSFTAKAA